MKNILFFCVLLPFLGQNNVLAQGGLLLHNVQLVSTGSVKIVVENGRWKNTNSTFTPGTGTVKFTGNASAPNSVIEGNPSTFYNLEIAKSQNNLRLLADTTNINRGVVFTSRNVDINGKVIALGTNSDLYSENEDSRTYSALPLSRVIKTRNLNNPSNDHFGGMGIRFTGTGNFGSTTVDRRHKVHTLPTGNSIQKYWKVSITNNQLGQNFTLRYQYFDAELNGLNEANLTIFRSVDGINWTEFGVTANSTVSNYVEKTATIIDISGYWTLGEAAPFNGPNEERSAENDIPVSEPVWSIFPNPVSDFASVNLESEKAESVVLELLNAEGKIAIAERFQMQFGENTVSLNLQSLSPGIYFARIAGRDFLPISVLKIF